MNFIKLFLLGFLALGCSHLQKKQDFVKKGTYAFYEMEDKIFLGIFKCVTMEEAETEIFKSIFENCEKYGMKAVIGKDSMEVIKCDDSRLSIYVTYQCRK